MFSLFLYGIAQMSVVGSILHVGMCVCVCVCVYVCVVCAYIYMYITCMSSGNNLVRGIALYFSRINCPNGVPLENYKSEIVH